jgi:hypothetical protein
MKTTTTWARRLSACLVVQALGGLLLSAPAPLPREPSARAVQAFQRLGATYGRLYTSPDGWSAFYPDEEAEGEGMPAFRLPKCDDGTLRSLPAAGVPFALVLRGSSVTDEGLAALGRVKNLRALDLGRRR